MNKDSQKKAPRGEATCQKTLYQVGSKLGEQGPTSPVLLPNTVPYSHRLLKFTLKCLTHVSANLYKKTRLFGSPLKLLLLGK